MAGVKGRSGGARPNSGGKRPGAGRKPKGAAPESAKSATGVDSPIMDGTKRAPLEFLELVLNEPGAPLKDRIRAAIAAAQYRHTKTGDGGKKDEADARAKKAATGRFASKAPPRLVVNNP